MLRIKMHRARVPVPAVPPACGLSTAHSAPQRCMRGGGRALPLVRQRRWHSPLVPPRMGRAHVRVPAVRVTSSGFSTNQNDDDSAKASAGRERAPNGSPGDDDSEVPGASYHTIGPIMSTEESESLWGSLKAKLDQWVLRAKLHLLERDENFNFDIADFALGVRLARKRVHELATAEAQLGTATENTDDGELGDLLSPAALASVRSLSGRVGWAASADHNADHDESATHVVFTDAQWDKQPDDDFARLIIAVEFSTRDDASAPQELWSFERKFWMREPVVAEVAQFRDDDDDLEWVISSIAISE